MAEQRHFVLGVGSYIRVTLKAGVTVDVNCTLPGNRTVYQEVAFNVERRAVELKISLNGHVTRSFLLACQADGAHDQ